MRQIEFIYLGLFCKQVQGEAFFIVILDVSMDHRTLPVTEGVRWCRFYREACVSHELYHKDFHIRLANCLILGFPILHFMEDVLHAFKRSVAGRIREHTESAIIIFVGGELEAFDTYNDILHRVCVVTNFSMSDIRVDNDKLVGGDWKKVIFDLKLALATNDIEQFGVIVDMGGRMPITAIPGAAGVAQY